jgi:tetratricopeptide (TPR) repeat protein
VKGVRDPHAPADARAKAGLTLCMIVRDEAENLARCLDSVHGVAGELVVVDTGSRDATVDIARTYGAVVAHHVWRDDFAAARNQGLDLATGEWVLVLDADEELTPEGRRQIPALLQDSLVTGYLLQIANILAPGDPPALELSAALRLFRNHPAYRFQGALHEQVGPSILAAHPAAVIAQAPVQILHHGYQTQVMAARAKGSRNRRIAERMVANDPADPVARGSLGIECSLAGEHAAAREQFDLARSLAPPGSPWHAQMTKHLAVTLCHLELWSEAADLLADALPLYPRYTDLLYLYGLALGQSGDALASAAALTQSLLAGPAPCPPYTSVDPEAGGRKAQLALALLQRAEPPDSPAERR